MSAIVHPITCLNLFNAETNASTCTAFNYATMMTSKVSSIPKNTYLKCDGRALSSNFGDYSTDDFAGGESRFFISNSNFFGLEHNSNLSSATTNSS